MDELIKDFLQESTENLDRLDQDFVKLEHEPENLELLKSIFRTIHTIKGTCGFLGFAKLESLTHAGESLLSLLRDGELQLTEASADVLLEMVDAVRQYLHEIEQSGEEGRTDTADLIVRLKRLQERNNAAPELPAPPPVTAAKTAPAALPGTGALSVSEEPKIETGKSAETASPIATKTTTTKPKKISRTIRCGKPGRTSPKRRPFAWT